MREARARLVRHATADGLMEVWAHVPLGEAYRVDLDSRSSFDLYNVDHGVAHAKELVRDLDHPARSRGEGWLPVECLAIDEPQDSAAVSGDPTLGGDW